MKSISELKFFLRNYSVADKYSEETLMKADTTENYQTCSESIETPKKSPPLHRKTKEGRSVMRPRRKFMLSPIEQSDKRNLANAVTNALVPVIVSAIQPAVKLLEIHPFTKKLPFQLKMDPIKNICCNSSLSCSLTLGL